MSETREKVNDLAAAESPEDISQRDKHTAELKALEVEFRAAIEDESTVTTRTVPETSESREYRELEDRVNVGSIVKAVADAGGTVGAERELQQHLNAGGNFIPLSLLRDEHRAATVPTGDEPSATTPLIDQVFPSSIMAFAGVDLRERPAGELGYPVITTGVTIHAPAGSAAAAETDGAIAVTTLAPKRLQGSLALRRRRLGDVRRAGQRRAVPSPGGRDVEDGFRSAEPDRRRHLGQGYRSDKSQQRDDGGDLSVGSLRRRRRRVRRECRRDSAGSSEPAARARSSTWAQLSSTPGRRRKCPWPKR